MKRERLELLDGDFLDLDWTPATKGMRVLVLHGLEGSLESHYAGNLLAHLSAAGYNAGLMYFRGCSGEPNRLPRSYHSGETGDLDQVITHLLGKYPQQRLSLIGFSLGGNVLLKWLGEQGVNAGINQAIAISVPFDLDAAARQLDTGLSRMYRNYLLNKLRKAAIRKAAIHTPIVPVNRLRTLRSFRAFDNAVTAPLHGFSDVDDYYSRASSKQFLRNIRVPTLILQSSDDPFLPVHALPRASELAPSVTLELSSRGGHVGFTGGSNPLVPGYWLEQRISQQLAGVN